MKVAAVQASPILPMDRDATVDKACSLVAEAGRHGAKLIVLPETFVPMYANWSIDLSNPGEWAQNLLVLTRNSIEIPGPQVERLCAAARDANATVCIGVNEYVRRYEGMPSNTLLFTHADGTILGRHRKVTPSNRERCFWARGDGTSLRVYDTAAGRIGGLICYEHIQPMNKYMLLSQGEQIHCSCWPGWPNFPNGRDNRPVIDVLTRAYALESQCFVVLSAMYIDPADGERAGLGNASWSFFGGSAIIGPEGDYIAGPVYDKETIVYGEVDFDRIVLRKAIADSSGKDNRWDIMRIESNARPWVPFSGPFGEQLLSDMDVRGQGPDRAAPTAGELEGRIDALSAELRLLRQTIERAGDTRNADSP
ncbi:MAG: carbon-nitrogen hydrolase family protein [Chloroflexi bacterium]|nr:carbon-nitrogen hydrolase family protein [Chloroflexota bacterium]